MFILSQSQLMKLEQWTKILPVLPACRKSYYDEIGRFEYIFVPTENFVAISVIDRYSEELAGATFCMGDDDPLWECMLIDLTEIPQHLV